MRGLPSDDADAGGLRDGVAGEVLAALASAPVGVLAPVGLDVNQWVAHWHGYEGSALARAIKDAGWRSRHVDLAAGTVAFVRNDD